MRAINRYMQNVSDKFAAFSMLQSFFHLYKTHSMGSCGLVISAGASPLVKSTTPVVAVVNGNLVYVAAGNLPALSGANLATANSNIYVAMVDQNATITWYPGTAAATVGAVGIPILPSGFAPIGSILVQNATGSNFVPGTTALDTASLTVTYNNTVGPFFPVHTL